MSNELVAGYAADGYTRVQGLDGVGALHVTYGVGSFVAFGAVAGAFVENVPLVVINGAPTNKEWKTQNAVGLIYQHMDANPFSNLYVYRNFTAAAERISNAATASYQIDSALAACLTRRQPVYLEVLEDVWRAKCTVPSELPPLPDGGY